MKRPIRWYLAAACSLLVFYVSCALLAFLFLGLPGPPPEGPLEDFAEAIHRSVDGILGEGPAILCLILLIGTPAALVTLFTYGYLRRPNDSPDGYLHCLKCGYILKGLSEPRCPECGERI
jgi:uncharacterized paraquat-inducible protein A